MLLDLRVTVAILDHRDPEVFRVRLVHQEKQENGVVMELMVLVGCQEKQGPRATEVSMASLDFLERKDIEENWVLRVLQDLQERMDPEERMARLDREVWLERAVLGVCSVLEGLRGLQDSVVFLDLMGLQVPKETWVLKEREVLLDSRVCLVQMVLLVLKVRSVLLVKKDLKVNRVWPALTVLTALLVTQEKRVLQARRELLVNLDLWDPSATPDLAV